MPAQAGARVERHEAERLGLGRVDHFPHVDAHVAAHQRELVGEADVDGAERVLEQLDELGGAGAGDLDDLLHDQPVERRRGVARRLVDAADDLGDVAGVELRVARIDALGREAQEEVDAGLEALGLEHRLHDLVGGAGIGRRLEDDELTGLEVLGDLLDRRDDVGEVRILRLAQRRRDADVDGVDVRQDREIGGGAEAAGLDHRRDVRRRDVADVGLALRQRVDLARVEVDADDRQPGLGELDRQRETDISEPDDPGLRRPSLQPLDERPRVH